MNMDQRGQALFEFILYLPVLIMMYFMISSIGNSINGSINQQKITRSYYFSRIKNNSYVPKPDWASNPEGYPSDWTEFGMSVIGFKVNVFEPGSSEEPEAACFQTPISDMPVDNSVQIASNNNAAKVFTDPGCDSSYSEKRTPNIRVYTVFGICGATYSIKRGHMFVEAQSGSLEGCIIN